jgi:hypothetical protein
LASLPPSGSGVFESLALGSAPFTRIVFVGSCAKREDEQRRTRSRKTKPHFSRSA